MSSALAESGLREFPPPHRPAPPASPPPPRKPSAAQPRCRTPRRRSTVTFVRPARTQFGHLLDGEAVRDRRRLGAAVRPRGQHRERALAVGLGKATAAAGY